MPNFFRSLCGEIARVRFLTSIVLLFPLFTGANAQVNEEWSLKFDGNKGRHVKVGPFYTPTTSYANSPFFVEAWLKPGGLAGARYWIAQGYGGAHILLVGVNYVGGGRVHITGNMNDGVNVNSFSSADTTLIGEWAHHAVMYVPAHHFAPSMPSAPTVYTFVNGVLSSSTVVVNPRANSGNWGTGSNTLEIGGTEHNNFDGHLSQVRLFEGSVPFVFDESYGQSGAASFTPERSFRGGFYTPNDTVRAGVSLLYDFRRPTGKTIPDLGVGFNGGTHTGVLSSKHPSYGQMGEPDDYDEDLPMWVLDKVKPGGGLGREFARIPKAAVLYDSFSRPDVTPATQRSKVLGLGDLEKGGSWQGSPSFYGILSGRAFGVSSAVSPVYANVGKADMDVIARTGSNGTAASLPMLFARYESPTDHLVMFHFAEHIYMSEVADGKTVQSSYMPLSASSSADQMRIVASGSTAKFYLGDTLVHTFTGVTRIGQNAGFWMNGTGRIDTFEVY